MSVAQYVRDVDFESLVKSINQVEGEFYALKDRRDQAEREFRSLALQARESFEAVLEARRALQNKILLNADFEVEDDYEKAE